MRAIKCNTKSTIKDPFYPGKPTSDVYDRRFRQSHPIPFLPKHVPQGLATWSNWPHGASGSDLLLITSYDPKKRYALINLDKARLFCFRGPSMAEGVAMHGNDLYVAYESGAAKFNPPKRPGSPPLLQEPRPRNKIRNLHRAKLGSLEELPPRSGAVRPGPIAPDKRKIKR